MLKTIQSLDQPYDIYFTGHSAGGAVALLASLFYANQNNLKNVESINCITFGQPALGDNDFNKFMLLSIKKINYRRYINMYNHTFPFSDFKTISQDPIIDILSYFNVYHPKISDDSIIYLNCKRHSCPNFSLGLHSSELYMLNLYNHNYSQCNTNCRYIEKNAKFQRYREYHCMVKNESIFTGVFNPTGNLPDKYSVCLFSSKNQFKHYHFSFLKSCNLKYYKNYEEPIVLIDMVENKKSVTKKITNSNEIIIVVENHNAILGTSSFAYNISFNNPSQVPIPPNNLTATIINIINGLMKIQINFNIGNSNKIETIYNVYFSNIGHNWEKFKETHIPSIKTNNISKIINGIPRGVYSIVVFAECNGILSSPSNIAFIKI